MSRVVLALVALSVCALLLALGCGGGDSSESERPADSSPEPPSGDASQRFLDTYVAEDGRVRRVDQGDDTVGEGQAYGMLVAAAARDEERFDLIWEWTKNNMRRPDGLISFLWRDGKIEDPEAASDADVDAARALLAASCHFERPAFREEALELGKAILAKETAAFQDTPVLVAGPWARTDPITLNPSYFSPATFAALGEASGNGEWGSLSASSRAVTDLLMPDPATLPPDWASVQGDEPVPTGPPSDPEATPQYGFDAFRTLVRLAEDPDPAGREIAARAWPAFEGREAADIPVEHDLSGKPAGDTLHPVPLVAAAGAAEAAGKTADRDRLLDAAEALDRQSPTYYGAAWVALGRIMLTTDDLDCA